MPFIKSLIAAALKNNKIGQKLNQDEATSFGTGFLAASLSRSFKVKPLVIVQSTPYDISMEISNLYSEQCNATNHLRCSHKPFSYNNTLIKKRTSYDTAKSVSFPYGSDLSITLYEHVTSVEGRQPPHKLMTFVVTGVNELAEKLNVTAPKVALRFEIDAFGMVDLVSAKVITEKLVKKSMLVKVPANQTANATAANATATEGNATVEKVVEYDEKVEEKHPLGVEKHPAFPLPMDEEGFHVRKARLDAMDQAEEKILVRAKAKNGYESLIYGIRDWLSEDRNMPFVESKVKDALLAFLAQEEEWLYKSDSADRAEFEKRTADLEDKTRDMKTRRKEFELFGSYITRLKTFIANATSQLGKIRKEKPWVAEEKVGSTADRVKELQEWTENKTRERAAAKPISNPVLTKALVEARISPVKSLIRALNRIEKPKPAVSPASNSTEGNRTAGADASAGTNETHSEEWERRQKAREERRKKREEQREKTEGKDNSKQEMELPGEEESKGNGTRNVTVDL